MLLFISSILLSTSRPSNTFIFSSSSSISHPSHSPLSDLTTSHNCSLPPLYIILYLKFHHYILHDLVHSHTTYYASSGLFSILLASTSTLRPADLVRNLNFNLFISRVVHVPLFFNSSSTAAYRSRVFLLCTSSTHLAHTSLFPHSSSIWHVGAFTNPFLFSQHFLHLLPPTVLYARLIECLCQSCFIHPPQTGEVPFLTLSFFTLQCSYPLFGYDATNLPSPGFFLLVYLYLYCIQFLCYALFPFQLTSTASFTAGKPIHSSHAIWLPLASITRSIHTSHTPQSLFDFFC